MVDKSTCFAKCSAELAARTGKNASLVDPLEMREELDQAANDAASKLMASCQANPQILNKLSCFGICATEMAARSGKSSVDSTAMRSQLASSAQNAAGQLMKACYSDELIADKTQCLGKVQDEIASRTGKRSVNAVDASKALSSAKDTQAGDMMSACMTDELTSDKSVCEVRAASAAAQVTSLVILEGRTGNPL